MTVEQFAGKHRLDLQDLRELNDYSSNLDTIKNGYDVFIPLTIEEGISLGFIKPDPDPVFVNAAPGKSNNGYAKKPAKPVSYAGMTIKEVVKKSTKAYYSKAETKSIYGFAAGNCTAYVAAKKPAIAKAIRKVGG